MFDFIQVFVTVMDTTYMGIRSTHKRVWLVERKSETDMAGSSIFDDGRSRTSERQFARMQILTRSHEHKIHTVTAGKNDLF